MMSHFSATPEATRKSTASASIRPGLLQRKCGCGKTSGAGECQECNEKPILRQRINQRPESNSPDKSAVPALVHEVLATSGHPLDSGSRGFFEPRLGHDFSRVRVHDDESAA